MADESQFADLDTIRSKTTDDEQKNAMENVSTNFYESREYKSTSEKCRSHQTLSFKRNLLDLEFNASHGDTGTKKCTEDLIDLFERKTATQASTDAVPSPRRKENGVPEHKGDLLGTKGNVTKGQAENKDDLAGNESDFAVNEGYLTVTGDHVDVRESNLGENDEGFHKMDEWSFDNESAEGTIDKVETPRESEDKFSEIDEIRSFVDFDNVEAIINNIDSISDKLELNDNVSTVGDVGPEQQLDLISSDTGINDDETTTFLNRIKILKHTMDEINSQIAIEKDFLRQEKLELENNLSLVSLVNNDAGSEASFQIGTFQDPQKSLEDIRLKERKMKLSFQMKQIEETEKMCASELLLMSNTANQVNQLNRDMANYSKEDKLSFATLKNNEYSLSSQRSAMSTGHSPSGTHNSPRLSVGSGRNTIGSFSSFSTDTKSFDRSLMSPIEFTMGDTRLQMKAADHFKMKISQLEAQLNAGNFPVAPRMMSSDSGVESLPLNPNPGPMKALL